MGLVYMGSTAVRRLGLLAIALTLAACSARDGGTGGLFSGGQSNKPEYTAADFIKTEKAYCPPVIIRPGTQTLTTYERGHDGEPSYVRYLASIRNTARECSQNGTTLLIKLGVTGRVVAGPKGGAGSLKLPFRVAIVKQIGSDGPLYSRLFSISVSLSGPDFRTDFSEIFDQIAVEIAPDDRNLIVYVGYDEGPDD